MPLLGAALSEPVRSLSNMSSTDDAFAALDTAVAAVGEIDWDALPLAALLEGLDRLETARRRATASAYDAAGAVDRRDQQTLGAIPHRLVADVVRISPGEAKRRIRMAGQLGPRTTLTGQPVPPAYPATAKAWFAGTLDGEHLRVIDRLSLIHI